MYLVAPDALLYRHLLVVVDGTGLMQAHLASEHGGLPLVPHDGHPPHAVTLDSDEALFFVHHRNLHQHRRASRLLKKRFLIAPSLPSSGESMR